MMATAAVPKPTICTGATAILTTTNCAPPAPRTARASPHATMVRTRRFYFETWPPPARIKVKSAATDKCVDMRTTSDHNLYIGNCHDDDNQKFYFAESSGDGPTHADVGLTVPSTSTVGRVCEKCPRCLLRLSHSSELVASLHLLPWPHCTGRKVPEDRIQRQVRRQKW
jgi:hypothetical protein